MSGAAVGLTHESAATARRWSSTNRDWPSAVFDGLVTNDNGRAVCAGLPGGELEVRVTAHGYVEERAQLELDTGARRSLFTVRKGRRVTGRIVDQRGVPAEGVVARVRGARTNAFVQEDGTYVLGGFELDQVPTTDFALAVRGPRFGGEPGPALVLTDLVAPIPSLVLRVPRAQR